MINKHTKLPWKLEQADRGFVISALQGHYDVCLVRDIGNQNNEANARHIVKCVNNHERLVGALRRWVDNWDDDPESNERKLLKELEKDQ